MKFKFEKHEKIPDTRVQENTHYLYRITFIQFFEMIN